MIEVKRMGARVERFNTNTKKSVGRLTMPEFHETWATWQTASDQTDGELPAYDEEFYDHVNDQCASARATLYGIQRRMEGAMAPVAAAGQAMAPAENGGNMNMRLPPIQPPTFSGEWVSFRDLFSALVIKNTSISNTHRLHLLRVACIGAAANENSGIELSEGNFKIACDNSRISV